MSQSRGLNPWRRPRSYRFIERRRAPQFADLRELKRSPSIRRGGEVGSWLRCEAFQCAGLAMTRTSLSLAGWSGATPLKRRRRKAAVSGLSNSEKS